MTEKNKATAELDELPVVDNSAGETKELVFAIIVAAVIALIIRTFAFEPFNIPSGSMLPTLKVGDYLFVSKYSYGYSKYSFPFGLVDFEGRILESQPERGDVAVFRKPTQTDIDYIKRIIGIPGDKVQVKLGILHINDQPVPREFIGRTDIEADRPFSVYTEYNEKLPNGVEHHIYEIDDQQPLDTTVRFNVPKGYYFVMGDNRDSSMDSRVIEQVGLVPAENLIGRAEFIFFSTRGIGDKCYRDGYMRYPKELLCKLVTWPQAIRYSRVFNGIN